MSLVETNSGMKNSSKSITTVSSVVDLKHWMAFVVIDGSILTPIRPFAERESNLLHRDIQSVLGAPCW